MEMVLERPVVHGEDSGRPLTYQATRVCRWYSQLYEGHSKVHDFNFD
jgi:hypothetical protein